MNPEKQTPPNHDNKVVSEENEPSNLPDPGPKPPDPDSQTISRPGTPAQTNQITVLPSKPTPKFILRYHPDPRIKKHLFKRPLEENEDNPNSKLPKQPAPIKPNQDSPPMNPAPGTTAQTQTNEPGHAPKIPTTFIHPNSYNEVLGTLMTGRVRTILGPTQEPIIFESDSESSGTEEELEADEDVFIVADRSCKICFRKPPNMSLERHRRLGGYSITHKLGMLPQEKKDALALLTLSRTVQNGILTCRHCNDFTIQLRDQTKPSRQNLNHLMTHGSLLGDNPSVQEVLQKQYQGPLICLECTEVFPSFLSLMTHCGFSRDHSEKREIFCNVCHRFYTNTTLISHHLHFHNNTLRCPMCDLGFVTIMDLLIHLMNSKPHYQLSPEVINMFTHDQIRQINQQRRPNTIATTRSELMTRETLKIHNLLHLSRYITQPELFTNFQAEIQDERFKMPDIIDLVARYMTKEDSLAVSDIIRVLRFGDKLVDKAQNYKKYQYEINQINVGIFLKNLWNNATILPTKVDDLMYGPDTYAGPHLLGQSYLTQSPNQITTADGKMYKAIVIGILVLDKAGTLPNSPFPTLNLSPDFSAEQKWPTHYYTHLNNSLQGIIHLEGKALHHLPADRNLLIHLKQIALKAPLNIPIFVELNLYPFLVCHQPETWANLLHHSLKSILLGFFCGLTRVSQEVLRLRGKLPEFVVLGQPPISGNFQIPSTVLLHLWYQINVSALLLARFTRTIFIPTTGVVGFGHNWYANILEKPHPIFNSDQTISNYSRTQAMQILQFYCWAKLQTENTLSV